MKTDKLIHILSEEGNAVKPLRNPYLRFMIWFSLSLFLMLFILPVFEHFFGHGFNLTGDLTGFMILLLSTLILGFLAFVMNRPVLLNPALKLIIAGVFFIWIIRTLIGLLLMEESLTEHIRIMYSGKPHAGCMTNTYLFFAIPFFIIIFMLRSGYTLEKTWAGFYAATASLSAAELMTSVLCPHTEPLHILAWHIIPIIPIPVAIWLLSEKIFSR